MDIVLPRKRDKNNVRYGFVKTITEEEAGKLILNAKSKGGWAAKIRIIINNGLRNDQASGESLLEKKEVVSEKEKVIT